MNFFKSIWHKYLLGKNIPWANVKHDDNGNISITDYNLAFVKSISDKLPYELIERKFDKEIVELWVQRYNLQREQPKLTVVHGKVLEDETIELDISWNQAFIKQLRALGFNSDSEEDIVHLYLDSMSSRSINQNDDEPELDQDLKEELFLAAQQAIDKK